MALAIVDSKNPKIVYEVLNEELSDVVKQYFALHANMNEAEMNEALWVFDEMKSGDLRLACDCQNGLTTPLLNAAYPSQLRRMRSPNPKHATNCVFGNRSTAHDGIITPSRDRPLIAEPLGVHGPFANPENNRGGGGRGERNGRHLPALSRVLFTLLSQAGINQVIYGEEPRSVYDQMQSIFEAAGSCTVCRDETTKVFLKEVLGTYPAFKLNGEWSPSHITLKDNLNDWDNPWPRNSRLQGYACALIDGFEENKVAKRFEAHIHNFKHPIHLKYRPHIFAEGSSSSIRAPYIAIISFAQPTRDEERILGLRCYAQPCFDEKNLFPVDSDKERDTLRAIETFLEDHPNISANITKPLFKLKVPGFPEETCVPDFEIEVLDDNDDIARRVVIETMGIGSLEYEDSKSRTHPLMARRGILVQHDMIGSSTRLNERNTDLFLDHLEQAIFSETQYPYPSLDDQQ